MLLVPLAIRLCRNRGRCGESLESRGLATDHLCFGLLVIRQWECGAEEVAIMVANSQLRLRGAIPEFVHGELAGEHIRTRLGFAPIAPCQNRVKTVCVGAAGVSFERKADSPDC
jgi:hypothetical protein